ncbi:hypothetical protein Pla110_32840 [Polystyrenella longa]|uniref:Uncharacterized protein n=1 Tax=Polystyrenella longa TaxID=2528007 RepID=A0A518CQN6_9PLAN|nr:hypothetical protein [Polystyrenella longa]QDU81542.1 hypothetical protein Pla110_32840 [Polystyrenella longa]
MTDDTEKEKFEVSAWEVLNSTVFGFYKLMKPMTKQKNKEYRKATIEAIDSLKEDGELADELLRALSESYERHVEDLNNLTKRGQWFYASSLALLVFEYHLYSNNEISFWTVLVPVIFALWATFISLKMQAPMIDPMFEVLVKFDLKTDMDLLSIKKKEMKEYALILPLMMLAKGDFKIRLILSSFFIMFSASILFIFLAYGKFVDDFVIVVPRDKIETIEEDLPQPNAAIKPEK